MFYLAREWNGETQVCWHLPLLRPTPTFFTFEKVEDGGSTPFPLHYPLFPARGLHTPFTSPVWELAQSPPGRPQELLH